MLPLLLVAAALVLPVCPRPSLSEHKIPNSEHMIRYKTDVLLQKILAELQQVETPSMQPRRRLTPELSTLLTRDGSPLGEGENVFASPINEDTSCSNGSSLCSRFDFEAATDGRSISEVHIFVPKEREDEPLFAAVCLFAADPSDGACDQLAETQESWSELGWAVFEVAANQAVKNAGDTVYATVEVYGAVPTAQQPLLVASVNPSGPRRSRRSLPQPHPPLKNCTCCLVDLYVSFKEIGWHWVVAPLGFNANMCVGTCGRVVNSYPRHYHIMMSTLRRNKTRGQLEWEPCCSPTRLSPLDMIYEAGNTTATATSAADNSTSTAFIHHKIPDMITESCGCW